MSAAAIAARVASARFVSRVIGRHVVAALGQAQDEVAADKPSRAGDGDPQALTPHRRVRRRGIRARMAVR